MREIYFFIPFMNMGGAERITANTYRGLKDLGHSVKVILCNKKGDLLDEIDDEDIINLNVKSLFLAILPLALLFRNLSKKSPVVFAVMVQPSIIAVIAKILLNSKIELNLIQHSHFSSWIKYFPSLKFKLIKFLMQIFYPFAHRVICIAKDMENDYRGFLNPKISDRILTLYNPLQFERVCSLAKTGMAFECRKEKRIVFVGRLESLKNIYELCSSIMNLNHNGYSIQLDVVGDGPELARLNNLVQNDSHQCIFLRGRVNNPYAVMASADLIVLPSKLEGFPTVLLEALILGKPILASDCHSGPAEIINSPLIGELFPNMNFEQMQTKLIAMLYRSTFDADTLKSRANDFSFEQAITAYSQFTNQRSNEA